MSQGGTNVHITPSGKQPGPLPGLPRGPLTAQQQQEAVRRTQAQAEQRVKLGLQLFKAAEAHTRQQQDMLAQLKGEQEKLRVELQDDVARSIHAYDQWVGRIDESFTNAIQELEKKVGVLQNQWSGTQDRVEAMMKRSEALLDQARILADSSPAESQKITPKPINPLRVKSAIRRAKTDDRAVKSKLELVKDGDDATEPPPPTFSISPAKASLSSATAASSPEGQDHLYSDILSKLVNDDETHRAS